jgi:hypothetical protein
VLVRNFSTFFYSTIDRAYSRRSPASGVFKVPPGCCENVTDVPQNSKIQAVSCSRMSSFRISGARW